MNGVFFAMNFVHHTIVVHFADSSNGTNDLSLYNEDYYHQNLMLD